MNLPELPEMTFETIRRMEDFSFFTHALIFDDLLIVAQRETNCFVLKTDGGLILIDAIWPCEAVFHAIVDAVCAVGWNPDDFRMLLLTHGHVDHTGCGRWFVERWGVETCLSETDDRFWQEHPAKPDRPETWKDYDIDRYLADGDAVTLGNTTIRVYATPGHTPGCLSYLFPVTENGKTYMAGLWGGTTPPWDKAQIPQYLASLDYFQKSAAEAGVSVALSNHTAIDNGLERIAYSRKRTAYLPNIYVIGQDGFQAYCQAFRTMSRNALA
jgi:metallo-beta-lactamase class B